MYNVGSILYLSIKPYLYIYVGGHHVNSIQVVRKGLSYK